MVRKVCLLAPAAKLTVVCFAGAERHGVYGVTILPFTARGALAGDAW